MKDETLQSPVLVIGATGYVGARLVPALLARGLSVRAAVRQPAKLVCRPFARHEGFTAVAADVMDTGGLARAAEGCQAAYYLVHSMGARPGDFAAADRKAATSAAGALKSAGVSRVIYLGGLGEDADNLSHHLRSRKETGEILGAMGPPLTWLRAAMILGSGSASFEILRYLCERLPVMLTPRWVYSMVQPIAISDVIGYLDGCLANLDTTGQTLDIGGPDVLTYADLFQIFAEAAGLPRRRIIPMPFFGPALSAYWISILTPVPAGLARPLAEGLRNTVVCRDNRIRELVPIELSSCRQAIERALDAIHGRQVESCWHDAGLAAPPEWAVCGDAGYAGGDVLECNFRIRLAAPADRVWQAVCAIGGEQGWYFGDILWRLRGALDKLAGGVGHGRVRRHPEVLHTGDALGFWRVAEANPQKRLLLLAEMRVPGQAVLEFELNAGESSTWLDLCAQFLPRGLLGLVYWRAMAPFHAPLFKGLLRGLAGRAGAAVLEGPFPFTRRAGTCGLPATPGK